MNYSPKGYRGRACESLVLNSMMRGDVRLTQIGQEARHGRGGKLMRVAGPCDFIGIYKPTGTLLILDAKETAEQYRFPAANLKPHQRDQLIAYGQDGAIAGLLIEATTLRQIYWLRWQGLLKDAKSWPWDHPEMFMIGSSALQVNWTKVFLAAAPFAHAGIPSFFNNNAERPVTA